MVKAYKQSHAALGHSGLDSNQCCQQEHLCHHLQVRLTKYKYVALLHCMPALTSGWGQLDLAVLLGPIVFLLLQTVTGLIPGVGRSGGWGHTMPIALSLCITVNVPPYWFLTHVGPFQPAIA